ncbi:uncharacterized protein LOC105428455 [Pogonomyrmex barbatus]|uniref:Uncharacterized protein LOC105428455 n=1 Tax=Pogonomyrmex barbatus TaxID=144034 RepID=A0A6I9WAN5_9HYME|nr:uncharacterized protein LOC105428455 [Pogonomyrmex barbatus]
MDSLMQHTTLSRPREKGTLINRFIPGVKTNIQICHQLRMRIGYHAEEQKRKSTGYRLDYYSKHASVGRSFLLKHSTIRGASRRPALLRERASVVRLGYLEDKFRKRCHSLRSVS